MTIEVFRDNCIKLQKRFGTHKLKGKFLNDVWTQIKHEPDNYWDMLEQRFTGYEQRHQWKIDDFLKHPTKQKHKSLPRTGWQPTYKHKKRVWSSGLKDYLNEVGASSVVEAMQIVKNQKTT